MGTFSLPPDVQGDVALADTASLFGASSHLGSLQASLPLSFSQPTLPRKVKSLSSDVSADRPKLVIQPQGDILSTQPALPPAGALGLTQSCQHTQSQADCEETLISQIWQEACS